VITNHPGWHWRAVTIRQMLSHTSDLPDIMKSGTPDPIADTPEEVISLLHLSAEDLARWLIALMNGAVESSARP
jgi:hypothetical protein